MEHSHWPDQVYRRYSVDIHIPDWDSRLLSRFDARTWVEYMVRAGNQSLLQYTNSHVGLCLWNTKVGPRHANMPPGRDFFGEVVAECRNRGIHPLAYFSVIFDNWAFEHHPDWRILPAGGYTQLSGRYGTVCPNSPYRDYVFACVREIVGNYDIDGIFFDMTFWPAVCYCPHCTSRYRDQYGAEPPRIVNWGDSAWLAFQKSREEWLLEFAHQVTNTVRLVRPGITVNHQFSTIFHNWSVAVPLKLAQVCDYVGGDFYGGPLQHSLACKVYTGLSLSKPFEFHTSRTRLYTDHVTVKPMDELRTEAFVATLHSAALMLVDYINADGTLNSDAYDFLGKLAQQRSVFEPYLGGEMLADVAIYYDKDSMYNPYENGVDITQLQAPDRCPHRDAVLGIARILQESHIPFGVVTNANLEQLEKYRAVILPSVLQMTVAQAESLTHFVAEGGAAYFSCASQNSSAQRDPGLILANMLGVKPIGTLGSTITYLTPQDTALKQSIWPQDHLSYHGPMIQAEMMAGTQALAAITLPFIAPEIGRAIGSRFAAIHSNPPALSVEAFPAVTLHQFGKGTVVWTAAPFEDTNEPVNQQLVLSLLRRIVRPPYRFEADAHPSVEITLFHQLNHRRLLVGLLNMQRQLPQVPTGASVKVMAPAGSHITSVRQILSDTPVPFSRNGAYFEFVVPPFEGLAMYTCELTSSG